MLNIFELASNDQSIYYLQQVFGPVGEALPLSTSGTVSVNLLFGVMFQIFNTIALTAASLVIVYTTVVGLLMTAQEGEFLKKWHGIWVPIRMVLGTAALFPGASGYSLIQVIVMWLIVQGIGAADTLWTGILNYANKAGSPFAQVQIDTSSVKNQVINMFQNSVCQETKHAQYVLPNSAGSDAQKTYKWYCASNSGSDFCKRSGNDLYNAIDGPQTTQVTSSDTKQVNIIYGFGGKPDTQGIADCGTLSYADPDATDPNYHPCQTDNNHKEWGPNSLLCLSLKGVQQAVQSIVPVFGAIAKQYALIDYQYVEFYVTPVIAPSPAALGIKNPSQMWQSLETTGTKDIQYNVEPPSWIKNYCTEGLNLPADQCCVNGPPDWCPASKFPLPYDGNNYSDTSYITGNPLAIDAYLTYAIEPYLGPDLDIIDSATNQIIQQGITGPYTQFITALGPSDLSGSIYQTMQQNGWLTAGSYYFQFAQGSNGLYTAQTPTLSVTPTTKESQALSGYRISQFAAGELVTKMGKSVSNTGLGAITPGLSKVTPGLNYMVTGFIYMLNHSGSSNPIVSISTFGFIMMVLAEVLFVTIAGLIALYSFLFSLTNFMILGTGFTLDPAGETFKAVVGVFEPIIYLFLAAMFTIGALLGIYLPLIPFLVFTVTAIGWFIGVIEAMVASPIIALGILSPGGQHEIMGKAEASVMILFNLFLRPSLIVFGFVAASILIIPIISFFNEGFLRTVEGFMKSPDLIVSLALMSVYASLILTVVSKVFSLVHMVPERILTYLGVSPISYGEAESLGAAKEAVSGAAGGMAGAGKEAGRAGAAGAEAKGKAEVMDKEGEAKKKGKLKPGDRM